MSRNETSDGQEHSSGRFSIARIKSVKLEDIKILKALEDYGIHHAILRSLRVAGKPVTTHHLTMMSPYVKRELSVKKQRAYPSERIVRKRGWYITAAIIAEIYCELDVEFAQNPQGSLDARHLLDTWEIFMASRRKSPLETPQQTILNLKREGIDIRLVWQILEAMAWNLISLEHCGECHRPYLKQREAEIDSTWSTLTSGCASCAELRRISALASDQADVARRRRRRAKTVENPPLYGAFSEQLVGATADTVEVCDAPPVQKRLFSV